MIFIKICRNLIKAKLKIIEFNIGTKTFDLVQSQFYRDQKNIHLNFFTIILLLFDPIYKSV